MKANVSTKTKTWSIIGVSLASVLIIFAFCGRYFNSFMKNVANFFVGSFGMAFYGIMAAVIVFCSFALAGKRVRIPGKYLVHFIMLFVAVVLFVHTLTTTFLPHDSFSKYVGYVYNYYDAVPTFGGVVFGSIAYALQSVLHLAGALIVYAALLAETVFMVGDFFYAYATGRLSLTRETKREQTPVTDDDRSQTVTPSVAPVEESRTETAYDRAMSILYPPAEQSVKPVQVTNVTPTQNFDVADRSTLSDDAGSTRKPTAEEMLFPKEVLDRNRTSGTAQNSNNGAGGSVNNGYFNSDGLERTQQNISAEPTINGGSYFSTPTRQDTVTTQPWQTTPAADTPYKPDASANSANKPADNASSQGGTNGASQSGGWRIHQSAANNADKNVTQSSTSQTAASPVSSPKNDTPTTPVAPVAPVQTTQATTSANDNSRYDVNNFTDSASGVTHTDETDIDIVNAVADDMEPDYNPLPVATDNATADEDDCPFVDEQPEPVSVAPVPVPSSAPAPVEAQPTTTAPEATTESAQPETETVHRYAEYVKPPIELLAEPQPYVDDEAEERQAAADAIIRKLAVFNIQVSLENIIVGPAFSRYLFKVLSEKTRMSDFAKYSDDIRGCIEAPDDIRILAPVPSTNLIGIEVANKHRTTVTMREMLESPEFVNAKGNLCFVVGKAISGKVIVKDLTKLTHLLVAGQTNSGKSVCVHSLIISMLYKYGPEYVRFLMVDPKIVELSRYNGLPHMLTTEAITEVNDALAGMDYLVNEMEARYQLFKGAGVGNIAEYNRRIAGSTEKQRLPYIVFVCDELADLMARNRAGFEGKLCRLSAKARAAGIHLVLATQRPDVKTITGTIKSNLPARFALTTASPVDSVTILGCGGAEKLLNYGDMLVSDPSVSEQERVQGCFVSNDELHDVVDFLRGQNECYFDAKVAKEIFVTQAQAEAAEREAQLEAEAAANAANKENQIDPYCKRALRYWLEHNSGKASIASIQRNLGIGFNRAGRIVAQLQQLHYIEEPAPSESGSKPLKVLVTVEQLDELLPDQEG